MLWWVFVKIPRKITDYAYVVCLLKSPVKLLITPMLWWVFVRIPRKITDYAHVVVSVC